MASEAALGEATSDLEFTRLVDAPRALVFEVWTEPKPSGLIHFCHRYRGTDIWVKGAYREFVAGERLVFELGFVDVDGRPTAHPMFPDWPAARARGLYRVDTYGSREKKARREGARKSADG